MPGMSYDSWLEGPFQRMVEQGEAEMLAREEADTPRDAETFIGEHMPDHADEDEAPARKPRAGRVG